MHFKTWSASLVSYFGGGTGFIALPTLKVARMFLANHTANLPVTATTAAVNKGVYAATATPFGSTATCWSMADPANGGWHMDDNDAADADTIHRMWLRSVVAGNNYTQTATAITQTQYVLRNANATASMANATAPLLSSNGTLNVAQQANLPLDTFMMFNVSIVNQLWVTSSGYLAVAPTLNSTGIEPPPFPIPTSGFNLSYPGPALLLGAAPRALRGVWVDPAITIADMTFCILRVSFNRNPTTNRTVNVLDFEVTFARDTTYQYIEIRGNISGRNSMTCSVCTAFLSLTCFTPAHLHSAEHRHTLVRWIGIRGRICSTLFLQAAPMCVTRTSPTWASGA